MRPTSGLESGVVRLELRHSSWRREFERAARRMRGVLSVDARIEHVGSTSVPGLMAKPIVDIAIGVPEDSVERAVTDLRRLDYRDRGVRPEAGGRILDYLRRKRTTRHVHIVIANGDEWVRYLLFRELLRNDSAARECYAAAKVFLAARYRADRRSYTAAKAPLIDQLVADARQSSGARAPGQVIAQSHRREAIAVAN